MNFYLHFYCKTIYYALSTAAILQPVALASVEDLRLTSIQVHAQVLYIWFFSRLLQKFFVFQQTFKYLRAIFMKVSANLKFCFDGVNV